MYIKLFSTINDSHFIKHHSFADDVQLQMSAPPDKIFQLLHSMQSCISAFKASATANVLRLNDKTDFMIVTLLLLARLINRQVEVFRGLVRRSP